MSIHIGSIIREEFIKTGWSVTSFAEKIKKDRTIVYHIFKRKSIDTQLLFDISTVLQTDFFSYYSRQLSPNGSLLRPALQEKPDSGKALKKVLIEVELSEEEFQSLITRKKS